MTMEYRPLGRCGAKVSALGIGGWTTFGDSVRNFNNVRAILRAAYDGGINFFDIADVYAAGEAERLMGKALREFPRHTYLLSSKVFFPMSDDVNDRGLSRKHIMESVEKSLKRIGTDYLDVYFCHRFDENTPLEETARAMDDLVHQGKIIYWGTSEWPAEKLRNVHDLVSKKNLYAPQVEQPRYNLLTRNPVESDIRPAAEELGMGLVIWSPLESGILAGNYDDGIKKGSRLDKFAWLKESVYAENAIERVKSLKPLAEKSGCTRAQLALAWVVRRPGVSSVLLGATKVSQMEENLKSLSVPITSETAAALDIIFP